MRSAPLLVLALAAASGLVASPALAQDGACTLAGATNTDTTLNPPIGEDDGFLGGRSRGLPYIVFVIDSSEHMRRFNFDISSPAVRAQGLGCSNGILNSLIYEANPCVDGKGQLVGSAPSQCNSTTRLPAGWQLPYKKDAAGATVSTRTYAPYDNDMNDLFDNGKFYLHDRGWGRDSTDVESSYQYGNGTDACTASGIPAGDVAACAACLTSNGYYLPTNIAHPAPLAGNWANFNPPKYVVARRIMKDQFAALDEPSRNRQALLTIVDTHADRCFSSKLLGAGMDSSNDGVALIGNPTKFKPPCNQFSACAHNGSSGGGRSAFDNQVNGQSTLFTSPRSPCPTGIDVPTSAPAGTASVGFTAAADGTCHGEYRDAASAKLADAVCAPYAEALLNAGQYFTELNLYDTWFPSKPAGTWRKSDFDEADGVCGISSCNCPRPTIIFIAGGGPDFDDNLPCEITGIGCASTLGSSVQCGGAGAVGNMARVAKFLATRNVRPSTTFQNSPLGVKTYVIGFGSRNPALAAAAEAGDGQFFVADTASQLRSAINDALQAVSSAQLSFSNANVTAVQTRTSSALLVPRFTPSRQAVWEGHLYQFQLISEDACGCMPTAPGDPYDVCDFNQDRRCGGVFFKDDDDHWIAAGSDGVFRKAVPQTPVSGAFNPGTVEADSLWDAAEMLNSRSSATGAPTSRKIMTVVDSNNDGVFDYRDNVVPFDETMAASLLPYFNIGTDDFCATLSNRLMSCLTPTQCATKVIQFVRGMDVFDEDCDLDRTDDRPFKLGDIYHSSPVLVDPPLPERSLLCALGLHNQCVVSLFRTSTQMDPTGGYREYVDGLRLRNKLVLVGANDGMVHAFHGGTYHAADNPRTTDVNECPAITNCSGYYDWGTGDEVWAFIPPDLLPKLPRMLEGRHQYFIDATPMVRDVWHDADNDNKKDDEEFHTLAVIGERRGGNHYFALDITDPAGPSALPSAGFFRWMWPQPNTEHARVSGESFAEFLPGPPPIGPVRLKTTAVGTFETHKSSRYVEKWIVMLNGGYDQSMMRGRSVNVVDAWLGGKGSADPLNPYWTFTPGAAGSSFAATPAMVGFGDDTTNEKKDPNGFYFDTATIGDTSGQLWALRFNDPDTTNWAGGRVFQSAAAASGACARQPIFQMTANSILSESGHFKTMIGTGDRFNLTDVAGGECSATNLMGCVRRGCRLVQNVYRTICGKTTSMRREWTGANTATSCPATVNTLTLDATTDTGCCTKDIDAQVTYDLTCTNTSGATVNMTWNPRVECGSSSFNVCGVASTHFVCGVSNDTPFDICATFDRCAAAITPPRNGFYSVKTFDDTAGRNRQIFDTAAQATVYDTNHLTTTNLAAANLYNADAGVVTANTSDGWYALYGSPGTHVYPQTPVAFDGDAINERTVTQASLIGGCAFWSTLTPANTNTACSTSRLSVNTQYHLNFLNGGPCTGLDPLLAASRMKQNQDTLPPAPPQIFVPISPKGQVSINLVGISRTAGSSGSNTPLASSSGIVKEAYRIDVSREVHACRHPDGWTVGSPPQPIYATQRANAAASCAVR